MGCREVHLQPHTVVVKRQSVWRRGGLQVGGGERRYHVVITAQGSAVHWQARVHYYW